MIVLIDNYDSFSYNLVQLAEQIRPGVRVIRNDAVTVKELEEMHPSHIILSPGPVRPEQTGICMQTILTFTGRTPILGVCLGHQAICQAFGGRIVHADVLMHGKQSAVKLDPACRIFGGLPAKIKVARYHSLAVQAESLHSPLMATAFDADGTIMAVQHKEHPTYGLQFHPESILTPCGEQIMQNFLSL